MGNIIFIAIVSLAVVRDNIFTKIMLPMLKLDTNYGFNELFLKSLFLYDQIKEEKVSWW